MNSHTEMDTEFWSKGHWTIGGGSHGSNQRPFSTCVSGWMIRFPGMKLTFCQIELVGRKHFSDFLIFVEDEG